MAIETIGAQWCDGYQALERGTLWHADQWMKDGTASSGFGRNLIVLADGAVYSLEGEEKTPTLWLTREPDNLLFRHTSHILGDERNFDLTEILEAMNAKNTLRIDLTQLRLITNKEWGGGYPSGYLNIHTKEYDSWSKGLNTEERKLAERFYGSGEDFIASMKRSSVMNESEYADPYVKIQLLTPDYVRKTAQEKPIWQIVLGSHPLGRLFTVYDRGDHTLYNMPRYVLFRGVLRDSAKSRYPTEKDGIRR